jgi:integrase
VSSLPTYHSWLGPCFLRYVELRRASGADYTSRSRRLAAFDRYLAERTSGPPLETEVVRDYLAAIGHLSPLGRDVMLSIVWQALAYAIRHGEPVAPLPERPRAAPTGSRLREPFVLSDGEVVRLLCAAKKLNPRRLFSRATYVTLLGLLYSTGLRIGEALALDVGDLDSRERLLTIRQGKFKKQRVLPLPASTAAGLVRYLDHPGRLVGRVSDEPFFVSSQRRRLSDRAARNALTRAARLADVRDARGLPPRPHDLRYTFAAHRVIAWYREGRDVNALLPALSGYMGHVNVANTFTYLRAAELLLGEGARRFEASARTLLDGETA